MGIILKKLDIKDTNVLKILDILNSVEGGRGFLVGGAVRDILMDREPKDYDFCTNIEYDTLKEVFSDYKTKEIGKHFGVLQVTIGGISYEIAKFRRDGVYVNGKPESVIFIDDLYGDLKRRDLTINSIAYDGEFIYDYFNGLSDLHFKIVRFVGNPELRIKEDPIRILRAVRFATANQFSIGALTFSIISTLSSVLKVISRERIRDEFIKILLSPYAARGINMLKQMDVIKSISILLDRCIDFDQNNHHHDKDLFEHLMFTLDGVKNGSLELKLAALFHDIGKPKVVTEDENGESHYYNHAEVSSELVVNELIKLRFSNSTIEKVRLLVKEHMNLSQCKTKMSVKKLIKRMKGFDNARELIKLCYADGNASATGANIGVLLSILNEINTLEEDMKKGIEVFDHRDLKINGNDIKLLGIKEGKLIGEILDFCIAEVVDNPSLNNKEILIKKVLDKYEIM